MLSGSTSICRACMPDSLDAKNFQRVRRALGAHELQGQMAQITAHMYGGLVPAGHVRNGLSKRSSKRCKRST